MSSMQIFKSIRSCGRLYCTTILLQCCSHRSCAHPLYFPREPEHKR